MATAPPEDKPPTYNEATAGYGGPSAGGPAPGNYGPLPGASYPQQGMGYPPQDPSLKAYPGYPYQGGYQSSAPPGTYPVQTQPTYMTAGTTITVQPQQQVIVVGGCPACRTGVLEDDFTCLGVCCAIFFFPIGILCCLAMRQRRCPNCGAVFG